MSKCYNMYDKVTLLMAMIISTASILAMILAPTMTPNVAKAYSCSSSSSAGKTPSSSTSISGSKGSCSTSSNSSGKAHYLGHLALLHSMAGLVQQMANLGLVWLFQVVQAALNPVAQYPQRIKALDLCLLNPHQVVARKGSLAQSASPQWQLRRHLCCILKLSLVELDS